MKHAQKRLNNLLREGVTTIEIKSGYGLRTEDEAKMLRVARRLGRDNNIDVVTTFLGAHALPPEYADNADGYIDLVCSEMLPAIAAQGLADAVDAFCENIAFNTDQTRRVFDAARAHNLPVKLHAEQLSDQKGSILAADYHALSTDHLEYLGEDGVIAMAKAGVTAVLLPGAFYCLRETKLPPIDLLRQHGVHIALATDSNPGTLPAMVRGRWDAVRRTEPLNPARSPILWSGILIARPSFPMPLAAIRALLLCGRARCEDSCLLQLQVYRVCLPLKRKPVMGAVGKLHIKA